MRAQRRLSHRGVLPSGARAGMIEPMSIEVVYTAESTATGGGRDGHVKSTDGRIDLDTRPPKEMGGSGEGTNPEQLFSAGYAACFLGALRLVARNEKVDLDDATGITAQVGFGKDSEGGFGINAHLIGYLPGPRAERRRGTDGEGARRLPVLQGHPRQHRRQAVGEGLVAMRTVAAGRRRSGRRSGGRRPSGRPPVRSGCGELRRARQGFGRQHRRRDDAVRRRRSPTRSSRIGSTTRRATTGPTSGCPRCTPTPTWRRSTARRRRSRRPTTPPRQAGRRGVRHQRGRRPRLPPGRRPHRRLLGPDHGHASGQHDDRGVVVHRRPGDRPPTPTG